ncbi:hypothetical protein B0F90DRAFT_573611 [Multifurca ochricompacta]|uniref:Uncharacterized protein n=1 Tax=Multifurca ochricompacta TaxID=376703 RepID=A0AAD4QN51_9AGAM|nr:hypothetical protein B0F90DRAFT_573611 [Multifurca ochricompacta]
MNIEATNHYQLSGFNADAEWALLTPNDGILHLGPHQQPYSISLFHQLRCLDILRRDIIGTLPQEETKLSRHCLNYMRQMVLCRTDLAVDPVLGRELEAEVRADTNQCVDWRHVYQELERNQQRIIYKGQRNIGYDCYKPRVFPWPAHHFCTSRGIIIDSSVCM